MGTWHKTVPLSSQVLVLNKVRLGRGMVSHLMAVFKTVAFAEIAT